MLQWEHSAILSTVIKLPFVSKIFVLSSGTICAILVEGIKRISSMKIILNLDQWFRRCHLKYFLSEALAALVFSGAEQFMQFW